MTEHNRNELLGSLDDLGLKMGHLAIQMSRRMNDEEFNDNLHRKLELRKEQTAIQAKLDALE